MSARIIEILAAMAMKRTLGPLHVVAENQKTISATVLERHLDRIGDDLGGYAHSLRIEYDTLHAANQRLEGENKRLREALQAIYDCDYQAPHDASDTIISDSKKRCIFRMRKLADDALRGNGGVNDRKS